MIFEISDTVQGVFDRHQRNESKLTSISNSQQNNPYDDFIEQERSP